MLPKTNHRKTWYSLFSNFMCSSISLLHWLYVCTGKCVLCLKAHDSCNQLQNSCINYEFNKDLHNLSLTWGTIARELLRWKLEMHAAFVNRFEQSVAERKSDGQKKFLRHWFDKLVFKTGKKRTNTAWYFFMSFGYLAASFEKCMIT